MARIHGRNGVLYVAVASGGSASEIAYLNKWSIEFSVDDVEVTAFGDTNKTYVAGLPDASGSFGGFYDDASAQLYTAARDGVARKFYLYPNRSTPGQYWHGNGIFDFSVESGVGDAVTIQGNFKASSDVLKVG